MCCFCSMCVQTPLSCAASSAFTSFVCACEGEQEKRVHGGERCVCCGVSPSSPACHWQFCVGYVFAEFVVCCVGSLAHSEEL